MNTVTCFLKWYNIRLKQKQKYKKHEIHDYKFHVYLNATTVSGESLLSGFRLR